MHCLALLLLGTSVAYGAPETEGPSLSGMWKNIMDKYYSWTLKKENSESKVLTAAEPMPPSAPVEEAQKEDLSLASSVILPHKASYVISLNKNYGQDDVADANGWMTIQVIDTGDGWAYEQKSSLIIYNSEGEGEQINTSVLSWQNREGSHYRFTCSTLRNGENEEMMRGEAIKQNGGFKLCYFEPETRELTLPGNTIFPLHHLIHALIEAKAGKNVVSEVVFDGSSETQEPVAVDTVVGAPKDPHLIISGTEALEIKKLWPMHIAVYALNSNTLEPDYEMEQAVLDNGIIKDMTLDYGTFSVKATIEKIELFTS
jgi:hypothetical protein